MPRKKEHSVPSKERRSGTLDWESARVFLEVARHKSFRAAAAVLDQSVNALRRKLDQLETQLNATLVTRHVDGVRLTAEGQRILAIVQRMEADAFEVMRAAKTGDDQAEGEVKLAITEGLGSFWVAPRLVQFARENPNILVDMHCTMTPADVLRLEADVAVQLTRPEQKDVRVVKLGRMHLMVFIAQSLADREGMPKTAEDLSKHRVVVQAAEQLISMEEYAKQLGEFSHLKPVMRSNVSSSHYFGIATGLGIGLLPTYSVAVGVTALPVDIPFRAHQDIWLVYHPDAAKIPRVRKLIDWLIESFSPQHYPWFADERVHPRDFPKHVAGMQDLETYDPFFPEKKT